MITPRFKLAQDDDTITINIRAPYCSLKDLDVDVDGNVFLFACKPYYLRLTLPGSIVEESNSVSFDTNSGEFSFTYKKSVPGEVFKNLDLIATLLTPKVLGEYPDVTVPITVMSETHTENLNYPIDCEQFGCGFAMMSRNKHFLQVCSEFDEVFEIDPCEVSLKERRKLRIQYEQGKFNVEHYLADFFEHAEISEIIAQKCPYVDGSFSYTDKELDFLKEVQIVQHNLTPKQTTYAYNGLIDVLFAYCYDQRTTCFEKTSESRWTINKLASTLCWFEGFETPKETIVAAFRRSLIYPLYRNFDLSCRVFEDLKALIKLEQKHLLRVLIDIHFTFQHSDRYILNKVFIKDYLTFVMKWNQEDWKATVEEYLKLEIKKEDVGLNLHTIEEGFVLWDKFDAMKIDGDEHTSSSEDSSDDSSSSEYSTDSESESSDEVVMK